jgi:hypothetical protein
MTFIEHMHYSQLIFQSFGFFCLEFINYCFRNEIYIFASMIIHNHSFLQIKLHAF